jgi:two-component system, OmpR family, response regulator MprA
MTWRVLVIDDEPAVRHALERSLRYFGYEVASAAGGDSAYEILQHDRFDVILLDIRMPLMSGDTLFLAIIRRWPELLDRIILMSGDPENAPEGWSPELKSRPFLAKPFTLETLRRSLESVIEPPNQLRPKFGNGA